MFKNTHAKTKSNSKKGGCEYIENDKSHLNRCIVGGTWMEYYDATGEHHLKKKRKDTEYSNRQYWKLQTKR